MKKTLHCRGSGGAYLRPPPPRPAAAFFCALARASSSNGFGPPTGPLGGPLTFFLLPRSYSFSLRFTGSSRNLFGGGAQNRKAEAERPRNSLFIQHVADAPGLVVCNGGRLRRQLYAIPARDYTPRRRLKKSALDQSEEIGMDLYSRWPTWKLSPVPRQSIPGAIPGRTARSSSLQCIAAFWRWRFSDAPSRQGWVVASSWALPFLDAQGQEQEPSGPKWDASQTRRFPALPFGDDLVGCASRAVVTRIHCTSFIQSALMGPCSSLIAWLLLIDHSTLGGGGAIQ